MSRFFISLLVLVSWTFLDLVLELHEFKIGDEDDRARGLDLMRLRDIEFVQHDDIGELELFDK